jgi:hypothetical protein
MTATAVLRKEPSEAEVRTQALKDYDRECSKLQLVEYKRLMTHKDIGEALLPLKQFDGLRSNLAIYKWLHRQGKKGSRTTVDRSLNVAEYWPDIEAVFGEKVKETGLMEALRVVREVKLRQELTARPQGSQSARANKKAFAEAVKYHEMKQKGVPIPEIADQEGKTPQDVLDTLRILDLNTEKQEQIKQGKLDAKKAVQAQSRLMNQVIDELPNHVLLPMRIDPTSEVFLASLFEIKRYFDHLADMDLTKYPPALRQAIIQMAKNFSKDCERVKKAVEVQRIEWQEKTA